MCGTDYDRHQEQIHKQIHVEDQRQDEIQNVQQPNEAVEHVLQQQNPVMENAVKQTPVLTPLRRAEVEQATMQVTGQRMSRKDRNKHMKNTMAKQQLSANLRQQEETVTAQRAQKMEQLPENLRNLGGMGRQALAWLDVPTSDEKKQKNIRRMRNLNGNDLNAKFEEMNLIMKEFLAMDIQDLMPTTDKELVHNYINKANRIQKGIEMRKMIDSCLSDGMIIPEELRKKVLEKANLMEEIGTFIGSQKSLISNQYYSLLIKSDTSKLTEEELLEKENEAQLDDNDELYRYYTLIQNRPKFDRKASIQDINKRLKKEYEQKEKKELELQLDMAERQKVSFEKSFGADAVGYAEGEKLSKIPANAAISKAGLVDRVHTRMDVVRMIYLHRYGKTLKDELSKEDIAKLHGVKTEVEHMLSEDNTSENAVKMLTEMARGLLRTKINTLPVTSPMEMAENGERFKHLLESVKDYEQISDSHKDLKKQAEEQLSKEERSELMRLIAIRAFFAEAISAQIDFIGTPAFRRFIDKKPLDDMELQQQKNYHISKDFVTYQYNMFEFLKNYKGTGKLAVGFKELYNIFFIKRAELGTRESFPDLDQTGQTAIQEIYDSCKEQA